MGVFVVAPPKSWYIAAFDFEWVKGNCFFPLEVNIGEQFTPRIEFKIEDAKKIIDDGSTWFPPTCWRYGVHEFEITDVQLRYYYGDMDPADAILLPEATWQMPAAGQGFVWSIPVKPEDLNLSPPQGLIGFVVTFKGWYHVHQWAEGVWLPFLPCCSAPGIDCWEHEGSWDWTFTLPLELLSYNVEIRGIKSSFSVTPSVVGEAPFEVHFWDESTSPASITSWHWDFGDGEESSLQNPVHEYTQPGTYTVALTVSNEYGSDTHSVTITVLEAPVRPVFKVCWLPDHVDVDESFAPVLTIENQGGAGGIFLEAYTPEGGTKVLATTTIDGYADYECPVAAHRIDWYLGYIPTESQYVNITFKTGPVGSDPTDSCTETIAVTVAPTPPCTEGATKCVGFDLFHCVNQRWELKEENASACGYGPAAEVSAWPFILGGSCLLSSVLGYVKLRRK